MACPFASRALAHRSIGPFRIGSACRAGAFFLSLSSLQPVKGSSHLPWVRLGGDLAGVAGRGFPRLRGCRAVDAD